MIFLASRERGELMSNVLEQNRVSSGPRIELFHPRYATYVGELILNIQREEFQIPITLDEQPDLADIPGFYQRGNGNFWVALDEDRVVGTISLLDIGNNQVALRKMFVHPDYRGAKIGTAKTLLDAVLHWSETKGVKEIYLGTTAKFLAAHRFYAKYGFTEIDKQVLPPAFPIMAVDTKFFVRVLPTN